MKNYSLQFWCAFHFNENDRNESYIKLTCLFVFLIYWLIYLLLRDPIKWMGYILVHSYSIISGYILANELTTLSVRMTLYEVTIFSMICATILCFLLLKNLCLVQRTINYLKFRISVQMLKSSPLMYWTLSCLGELFSTLHVSWLPGAYFIYIDYLR